MIKQSIHYRLKEIIESMDISNDYMYNIKKTLPPSETIYLDAPYSANCTAISSFKRLLADLKSN